MGGVSDLKLRVILSLRLRESDHGDPLPGDGLGL